MLVDSGSCVSPFQRKSCFFFVSSVSVMMRVVGVGDLGHSSRCTIPPKLTFNGPVSGARALLDGATKPVEVATPTG